MVSADSSIPMCVVACLFGYVLELSTVDAEAQPLQGRVLCFSTYFQSIEACPVHYENYTDIETCCILNRKAAFWDEKFSISLSVEKKQNVSKCRPCSLDRNAEKVSHWSVWSACSTTCGLGVQERRRQCQRSYTCNEQKECSGPPCKSPQKIALIAGCAGGGAGLLVIIIAIIIICCRRKSSEDSGKLPLKRSRRRQARTQRFAPPYLSVRTGFTSPPPLPSRPPPRGTPEEVDMREIALYQPYNLQKHEVSTIRISKMAQFEENTIYYSQ